MNKFAIAAAVCILLLSGCKREAIPTVSKKDLKELNIAPLQFDYLSLKSKINFDDGSRNLGATANFRIKRDEKIWFSVSPGFGFEVARGLVTKDSLYLINKLQKEYHAYSFQELSQRVGVQLGYPILQAAILGDLARPLTEQNRIRREPSQIIVVQEEGQYTVSNYFNPQTLKLIKVFLQEANSPNSLNINYDDFRNEEGRIMPFSSSAAASYQKNNAMNTIKVDFDHQKAEFSTSPLSFPFSIPDNYVRQK
jgi:hypothetical protein